MLQTVITRRWPSSTVIVAGTGPSLSKEVADACAPRLYPTIAVNDAYQLFPKADILYACDAKWWDHHDGVKSFTGERWSCHSSGKDDKLACAERWGLKLVRGSPSKGFSTNQAVIHYGQNSGFQAINLAMLFGAKRVLLVGFDMRNIPLPRNNLQRHFFGNHHHSLRNSDPSVFIKNFEQAARLMLPGGPQVINCTPGSALKCFPSMELDKALVL